MMCLNIIKLCGRNALYVYFLGLLYLFHEKTSYQELGFES